MNFRRPIDLHEGKVKQIVGSSLSDSKRNSLVTNFSTDLSASHFAALYKRDGLRGGHVVMLGAGNEDAAASALAEFPQGFHIGGGITPHNARHFLDLGASHIIVTSCVFKDGRISWENLERNGRRRGQKPRRARFELHVPGQHLLCCNRSLATSHHRGLSKDSLETLSSYCDEFLIHAAHVEGKRSGPTENLVKLLGECSHLPVTSQVEFDPYRSGPDF